MSDSIDTTEHPAGPEGYAAYFEHFARGEYYECHEVLERIWLRDKRRFYQGLIQLAVAFYHLSRGNVTGGRKLLAAAEEKLREHPPGYAGMDTRAVADWIAECRAHLPEDRIAGPPVNPPMRRLTMRGIEPET